MGILPTGEDFGWGLLPTPPSASSDPLGRFWNFIGRSFTPSGLQPPPAPMGGYEGGFTMDIPPQGPAPVPGAANAAPMPRPPIAQPSFGPQPPVMGNIPGYGANMPPAPPPAPPQMPPQPMPQQAPDSGPGFFSPQGMGGGFLHRLSMFSPAMQAQAELALKQAPNVQQTGMSPEGQPQYNWVDRLRQQITPLDAVRVTSQAQFDALPKGTKYLRPDGSVWIKQ